MRIPTTDEDRKEIRELILISNAIGSAQDVANDQPAHSKRRRDLDRAIDILRDLLPGYRRTIDIDIVTVGHEVYSAVEDSICERINEAVTRLSE